MQYSVRPAGLLSCCETLEEAAQRLHRDCEALDNALRQLNQLSYLEAVCAQLRRERDKLEKRIQLTLTMAQAAKRCRETYQHTEQQVLEALDCPRHVLTENGATLPPAGRTEHPTGKAKPTESHLDWKLEISAYAAAFTRAGIHTCLDS